MACTVNPAAAAADRAPTRRPNQRHTASGISKVAGTPRSPVSTTKRQYRAPRSTLAKGRPVVNASASPARSFIDWNNRTA